MPSRWFSARLGGWITEDELAAEEVSLTKPLVHEVKPHRTEPALTMNDRTCIVTRSRPNRMN
jgi:hypothetical protein